MPLAVDYMSAGGDSSVSCSGHGGRARARAAMASAARSSARSSMRHPHTRARATSALSHGLAADASAAKRTASRSAASRTAWRPRWRPSPGARWLCQRCGGLDLGLPDEERVDLAQPATRAAQPLTVDTRATSPTMASRAAFTCGRPSLCGARGRIGGAGVQRCQHSRGIQRAEEAPQHRLDLCAGKQAVVLDAAVQAGVHAADEGDVGQVRVQRYVRDVEGARLFAPEEALHGAHRGGPRARLDVAERRRRLAGVDRLRLVLAGAAVAIRRARRLPPAAPPRRRAAWRTAGPTTPARSTSPGRRGARTSP